MHPTFRVFVAAVVRNTVGLVFHNIRQKQKTKATATPIRRSPRRKCKPYDRTVLTPQQEKLVIQMYKERLKHNTNRPRKDRISLDQFTAMVNKKLGLNKSRSAYGRIVRKHLPGHGFKS